MDEKVEKKLKGKKMKEKRENILKQLNKEYKKDVKELKLEDSDMSKLGVDMDATSDTKEEGDSKEGDSKEGESKEDDKKEGDSKEGDELPLSNIIQIESKRLIKKYIKIIIRKTIEQS